MLVATYGMPLPYIPSVSKLRDIEAKAAKTLCLSGVKQNNTSNNKFGWGYVVHYGKLSTFMIHVFRILVVSFSIITSFVTEIESEVRARTLGPAAANTIFKNSDKTLL